VRDQTLDDTVFFRQIPSLVPPGEPLLINAELGSMEIFRIRFYLGDDTIVLPSLSFLLDDRIQHDEVYLVTRYRDRGSLAHFGVLALVLRSTRSRREASADDRLTLFRLRFHDNLARRPMPMPGRISPMAAMGRAPMP